MPLFCPFSVHFPANSSFSGSCGISLLLLAFLSFDIARFNPTRRHPFITLLLHYAMTRISLLWGGRTKRKLIAPTSTLEKQQTEILMDILKTNASTYFGKKHDFASFKDVEEFREKFMLTSYEHYRPIIDERIVSKGRKNILTYLHPLYLAATSATTGKPKVIPLTGEFLNSRLSLMTSFALLNAHEKGLKVRLGKLLFMHYEPSITETEGGLKLANQNYFLYAGIQNLPHLCCNAEALTLTDKHTAFYVQGLFGLYDPDLGHIHFDNSLQLLEFWEFLVEKIEEICGDIASGKLSESSEYDIPQDVSSKIIVLNFSYKNTALKGKIMCLLFTAVVLFSVFYF